MPHDGPRASRPIQNDASRPAEKAASQPAQDDFTRPWDGGPPTRAAAGLFAAGELLAGRFRVVRLLGQGGMGEVWEAEDLKLGGRVAVKSVRPDSAQIPEALDRFLREVHLARQVTHPNVCRIFDIFQHRPADGRELTFLSMELLEGGTLREHLDGHGRLPPAEALALVRQMAAGLEAAHQVGVVHRDFKSANVMLVPSPRGLRAVITDFGLARSGAGETAGLTVTGAFLGTPAYMAPEQVAGEAITLATDLYALGVVLYEMVTGELPFQGETALSVAVKRLHQEAPSPRTVIPDLDPRWEAVIARCLERRPAERFASAAEVADALAVPASAIRILAPAKRRRRWLLTAAAVLTTALAAAAGWWLWDTWRPLTWDELGVKPERTAPAALAHYRDGLEATALGDDKGARESFERALEAQPDFLLARTALAATLVREGESVRAGEEGAQVCETAGVRRLPAVERQLVEARCHLIWGEWELAIPAFNELQSRFPRAAEYALGAAESQKAAGRPEEAVRTLEIAGQTSHDPRLDIELARAAYTSSNFRQQAEAAERAFKRVGAHRWRRLRANALLQRGTARARLGEPQAALADFQSADVIYAEDGDFQGRMRTLNASGVVLLGQGELDEARKRFEFALSSVPKDNPGATARQLSNLALIDLRKGSLSAAEKTYGTVLESHRERADRQGEGQALANLGLVLLGRGALSEALARFDDALAIARSLRSKEEVMNQQINRALTLSLRLESRPALQALDEAGQLAEEMAHQSGRAAVAAERGKLALLQGDLGRARETLEKAVAQQRAQGETDTVARTQLDLARVAIAEGRFADAERLAEEARKELRAFPDLQALSDALAAYAQLKRSGPAAAREAFDRAQQRAGKSEDFDLRGAVALLAARMLAAVGRPAEGLQRLVAPLAEARERGHAVLELDARLLQSELELATAADPAGARARLAALEKEARARRYGLVADKAKRLLEKVP